MTILATGDEVVPPDTPALSPGQVRDALSVVGRRTRARGRRRAVAAADRPRRGRRAARSLDRRGRRERCGRDLRRVVGRDARSDRRRRGRAAERRDVVPRARDQAGQADAARAQRRRPDHRPARQPALGARRLPADRDAARPPRRRLDGRTARSARSARRWPRPAERRRPGSTSSRSGWATTAAEPIFGSSALLSVLTAADGYVIVPEDANGLSAGEPVEVFPYG